MADPFILAKTQIDRVLFVLESEVDEYADFIESYLAHSRRAVVRLRYLPGGKGDTEQIFRIALRQDDPTGEWLSSFFDTGAARIRTKREYLEIAREKGRVPKSFFEDWLVDGARASAVLVWQGGSLPDDAQDYELPKRTRFMFERFGTVKAQVPNSALGEAWLSRFNDSPYLPNRSPGLPVELPQT